MSSAHRRKTALACDIGKKRHNNEDYALACEPLDPVVSRDKGRLYIVADGIGGGAVGEVASQFAAHSIMHHFYGQKGTPSQRLLRSFSTTNSDIHQFGQSHPRLHTMGTTAVAAAIRGDTLYVAHAGDSRAYLVRRGKPEVLTEDHNLAAQLAREGLIGSIGAARHPHRNLLLRSLGAEDAVSPDLKEVDLQPDDILLLCSDGLTRHLRDDEIARVAFEKSPAEAVSALIEIANLRGGEDNIAVLITRWDSQPDTDRLPPGVLTEPPPRPSISAILRSIPKRMTNLNAPAT